MRIQVGVLSGLFLVCVCFGCRNKQTTEGYLQQVLDNLEKVESATYIVFSEGWRPGEEKPVHREYSYIEEYTNPGDTVIGAAYVHLNKEKTQLEFAYDGDIRVLTYHDQKGLVVDDFSNNPYPIRLVTPPFFNYTKSIIRYILTTNDSIDVRLDDLGKEYHLRLTVDGDRQLEFFGAPHYVDNPYFDPLSVYEIWISKSTRLPYKVRRQLEHDISERTVSEVVLNTLDITDFDMYAYFPDDYEVRKYGERSSRRHVPSELEGKLAPDWVLVDMNEQPVSLAGFTSKVLLINFTGIGCAPCQAAIPFLKELKSSFSADEFDLVSIEGWSRKPASLRSYATKNEINYHFLCATDQVVEDYQSWGVPTFFILDEDRIIRKVMFGYSKGTTDEEIKGVIGNLQ